MSLIKFLAVGRSFVGLSHTSPYTVVPQTYLQRLAPRDAQLAPRQQTLTLHPPSLDTTHDEKVLQLAAAAIQAVNGKSALVAKAQTAVPAISPVPQLSANAPKVSFWSRFNPFKKKKAIVHKPV